MKIIEVNPQSLGSQIGLRKGDRLLKINGKRVQDELDYKFRITEEVVNLTFEINGDIQVFDIEKDYDDDLGVVFEEMKIRSCANDCVFCFVDQNPVNMRDGMYFRDGDYRMSYLYGHYITMTNMGQNELKRVVEQRMSPLYVSVHVTEPKLRQELFLYKKDDGILNKIKYLTENRIELHTQVVLMPELNDGSILLRTLKDLYRYYPMIKTCTIVPVGLTKHRKNLMKLKVVNKAYARNILNKLHDFREIFSTVDSPFVLLSDEWYILGDVDFPSIEEYGDADLIENGVGQVQNFLTSFKNESINFPTKLKHNIVVTIVTGTLISDVFKKEILPVLNRIKNLTINLVPITNHFFGHSVTVSGLLTGQDIVEQLKYHDLGDFIWVSHRILNDDGNLTLDDMTIEEISKELGCEVMVGHDSFLDFFKDIRHG